MAADSLALREGACYAEVTPAPLSLDACVARVADDGAGAVATFTGVTRNSFQGKATDRLEYEAYVPMATRKLLVRRRSRGGGDAGGSEAEPPALHGTHRRCSLPPPPLRRSCASRRARAGSCAASPSRTGRA